VDAIPSPEPIIPTVVEEKELVTEHMDVDPRVEEQNVTVKKNHS
jgi:hypothetical protein